MPNSAIQRIYGYITTTSITSMSHHFTSDGPAIRRITANPHSPHTSALTPSLRMGCFLLLGEMRNYKNIHGYGKGCLTMLLTIFWHF